MAQTYLNHTLSSRARDLRCLVARTQQQLAGLSAFRGSDPEELWLDGSEGGSDSYRNRASGPITPPMGEKPSLSASRQRVPVVHRGRAGAERRLLCTCGGRSAWDDRNGRARRACAPVRCSRSTPRRECLVPALPSQRRNRPMASQRGLGRPPPGGLVLGKLEKADSLSGSGRDTF